MTDPNWNLDDYQFDFGTVGPYTGSIVHMPIELKMNRIRVYLMEGILPQAKRSLAVQAELPSLLLLAVVDYLSGFFAGRKSDRDDFIAFMGRYFPGKYQPFLKSIYDQLRSGLMHNLVAANPYKPRLQTYTIAHTSSSHLEQDDQGKLIFSVSTFLIDVSRAWVMYSHELIEKSSPESDLVKHFHRRFNKLDGVGAFMEQVPDP